MKNSINECDSRIESKVIVKKNDESDSKAEEKKRKKYIRVHLHLLTIFVLLLLLFAPCLFKYYFSALVDFPFSLRLVLSFVSWCWIGALFVCALNRLIFIDGISQSDIQIMRILGQSAMLMVITGIILILLACLKVLFLL